MSRVNLGIVSVARMYILGLCCNQPKLAGYPQEDPVWFVCLSCGEEQWMT